MIPLQDMPHTFSSIHTWQIMNPQRQRQQKIDSLAQQWQMLGPLCRLRGLLVGEDESLFMALCRRFDVLSFRVVDATMPFNILPDSEPN